MNKKLILVNLCILVILIFWGCKLLQKKPFNSIPTTQNNPTQTIYILPPTPTPIPPSHTALPATLTQPTPTVFVSEAIPIIFDDDGSPDGTTALLFLLNHPQVDLQAINISFGEAHPAIYVQHIGRKLDSFGIIDIPLGYGQDSPISGTNEFPEGVRQASNGFWGWQLPNAEKTYTVQPAPELIVSIIQKSQVPVSIFISGPATNLAQALEHDPEIRNNISVVYMMGGAVYVRGNIDDLDRSSNNKVAEWNIHADPQAASEVFESGLNINLVPLDATNQVMVTRQDTLQWRQGGDIANFAADIYEGLLNNWHAEEAAIWDLMTAAIMLKPDLCEFTPLHLQVVTQEGVTSGQTVVINGEEANVSVCLKPDAGMIRQTLIDIFSRNAGLPNWIIVLTDQFKSEPVGNPPQSIWRYDYNGQEVYYVPAQCCDMYSTLYDADGNVLCAPDGGITGRGDGKCTDFQDKRTNETLIWQDKRSR